MPLLTRRNFIRGAAATGLALAAAPRVFGASRIDRSTVVRRHNRVVTRFDPFSALTVGNGEFAFTADLTGLQTFAAECDRTFPLCTTAQWSWHTTPAPAGMRREDFRYQDFDTYGRAVGYATQSAGQQQLFDWLRQNPHRLHLGRIGLELIKPDGTLATPDDLKNCRQVLDLWSGLLDSRFEFAGRPIRVQTCCHPDLDLLAVRIESSLLASGALKVRLAFPGASPQMNMADWDVPAKHTTRLTRSGEHRVDFERTLDGEIYFVSLERTSGFALDESKPHEYRIVREASGARSELLEFGCLFSTKPFSGTLPSFAQTQSASERGWRDFWEEGGVIDLGGCTDPRAAELERRIVLSLYNTAIHCAGSLPSAETGLLCNSWYGKFHLEMHWWHSVHFTAWTRFSRFERSLAIYERILPLARETAQRQGYRGARWPKMIGPDGRDSPSSVGTLLIWQQPHPIYYAELCYQHSPSRKTLERWRDVVFETADFMASFAVFVEKRNQFALGPPLKTVSENTDAETALNPAFELAYWRFGLRLAQEWRERLGLERQPGWDRVLSLLAPLPKADGLYLLQEDLKETYTSWNWEHPALVGALGMLPGDGVDTATMRRSLARVTEVWQWDRAWGWDFGNTAMCAARTGQPELAVKALLLDSVKNRYHPNGHNYQRENLPAYLPGNGALLCAAAMMCAGWSNGPENSAPGFPKNGQWAVRHEGLKRWL
jgi:protein-glucosylgalactosylhydroxylysine glucosidase